MKQYKPENKKSVQIKQWTTDQAIGQKPTFKSYKYKQEHIPQRKNTYTQSTPDNWHIKQYELEN